MKKRVVGAVVLVLIGVALPLMLARCMQDEDSTSDAMRVYEIAPDGQARPAGAPADGGKSNVEREALDGETGVPEPEEAHDTPELPEAVSPSATESTSASNSPQQPPPEPETEPAGVAATTAQPQADNAASLRQQKSFSGGYVVQVASFSDEANAERLAQELNGEFKAFYRSGDVNGKTYYRVRVGPFESEETANAAAAKLRSDGRATLVRRAE